MAEEIEITDEMLEVALDIIFPHFCQLTKKEQKVRKPELFNRLRRGFEAALIKQRELF